MPCEAGLSEGVYKRKKLALLFLQIHFDHGFFEGETTNDAAIAYMDCISPASLYGEHICPPRSERKRIERSRACRFERSRQQRFAN
jgi:hypothetical protein